jgi:hypothetical protein
MAQAEFGRPILSVVRFVISANVRLCDLISNMAFYTTAGAEVLVSLLISSQLPGRNFRISLLDPTRHSSD